MIRRALSPLLTLLLCLMPVVLSRAQGGTQVQISGTVAYNGCPYQNGRGRAILVSGNGSGQQAWTTGGTNPVPTPRIITALDSAGKFSMSLTSTALIDQQSAQPMWQFQLCSFNYPTTGEVCFTMTPLALTSSQDISSQIQSQSLPIPGCSSPSGGITFQHNGTVVATEPQYNMIDTGTAVWTVTDDPSHTRVNAQIAASGGGGGAPAGNLYDVQINDPLGMFGSDTGIGQIIPSLHTFYENILNANQQVDVSDATNNGLICQGHSTGSAVDSAFCTEPSATFSPTPTGGYGTFPPDNAPTAMDQVVTVASVIPVNVATKYGTLPFYPLKFAAPSAVGNCAGLAALDSACSGGLPAADPRSAIVQDKMCTMGDTPTCSLGGLTVSCSVSSVGTSYAHCTYSIDQPIQTGDTAYVEFEAVCGLGCSGVSNSLSDTQGNTWTRLVNSDGSGSSIPAASYWTHPASGTDSIAVNFDTSAGFTFKGTFHFVELRGTVTPDGNAFSGGTYSIPSVTTTNATDTILNSVFIYSASCTYTPGSGYGLIDEFNGTTFSTNLSIGGQSTNVGSSGTYTPTITATGSGCSGTTGGSFTQAFTQSVYSGPQLPFFRQRKWIDLVAGLDFPSQASNGGKCLAANSSGSDYQPLVWATCGSAGVSSIQFKNNGTNFGSPMTGVGSMNFVNCTVSGTTPDFTITCGTGMVWPSGGAGIPNYSGSSSWGTTYNASNLIPNNFLPAANFLSTFPAIATAQTYVSIAPFAVTFPANFSTPTAAVKCGTNPGGTVVFTLTDVTSSTTIGTVSVSSSCVGTFSTTGGTTQTMSANDLYTVVSGTDATAANVVIDFRATRN